MSTTVLVTLALFCVLVAAGLWLLHTQEQRESMRQRFEATTPGAGGAGRPAPVWGQLARHGQQIDTLFDEFGETERLLVQSGWRGTAERVPYFVLQALLPLAGLLAFLVIVMTGSLEGGLGASLLYGFAFICLGLLGPRWWLRRRARRRQALLRAEVPMLIHLCAMLFDAGLSLRQALASLTTDGQSVLPESSRELAAVLRQLETGADVGELMRATSRVLDVSEFGAVLAVLQQVDRYGGELRAPLMDALEVVEKRRELSLRERVNVLSGRMTIVMVLFFFPALLIFVAGPPILAILVAVAGAGGAR